MSKIKMIKNPVRLLRRLHMTKLLLICMFVSMPVFGQYLTGNNQLKFSSGMQIKDDGEVIYNKKKWDHRKKRKDNAILLMNDKKLETNTWDEGGIVIRRHKNKIEVKYKDLKADKLEVEYVFQGARDAKVDYASLTNYKDEKVSNFTTCVGKKCLSLTKDFCDKLALNIGTQTKDDAIAKARQCLSFSKAMGSFKRDPLIISDLKQVHQDNLKSIDGKIQSYFGETTDLTTNNQFELEQMVDLGEKNQDYFELLIQVLNSCQQNFP